MTLKKLYFVLSHHNARRNAMDAVMNAPEGWVVTIQEPKRTLDQNAKQWPILTCFSEQRQWAVNGTLEWLSPEEYKDILTAAFKKEQPRLAAGLDGGVVMLGQRTSKFSKKLFSQWIEFLHYAAATLGIELDEYEEPTDAPFDSEEPTLLPVQRKCA